ncbi:MAG: RnfABCDGE type electron transport complex subunit C [Salinispira sp.]
MNINSRGIKPYMAVEPDFRADIVQTSLPNYAIIPLPPDSGEEILVRIGERIREGQIISKGKNAVHASIPGVVRKIISITLPDKTESLAVQIKLDGFFDYTGKHEKYFNWSSLQPSSIIRTIQKNGLVQLDGSGENLSTLLENCRKSATKTIIVNAANGTPFLSSEIRILQEHPEKIATALQILHYILPVKHTIFAATKIQYAQKFLEHVLKTDIRMKTKRVPEKYPAGSSHEIIRSLPQNHSQNRSSSLQTVVLNISTLLSLYEGIVLNKSLIEKIITVGGGAFGKSTTVKARIGTPLRKIFQELGGLQKTPVKIVVGIPLRGHEVTDIDTPLSKEITSIFALQSDEMGAASQSPCINCGVCVDHCPADLEPLTLHKLLDNNRYEEALSRGLMSCWSCGICSHVCPSYIPLTRIIEDGMLTVKKEGLLES